MYFILPINAKNLNIIYYRRNDLKYSRRKGYAVTPPRGVVFITRAKKFVYKNFLTPDFNKRLLFAIACRKNFFANRVLLFYHKKTLDARGITVYNNAIKIKYSLWVPQG